MTATEDPQQSGFHDIVVAAWDTINGNGPILQLFRQAGSTTVPFTGGITSMEIFDPLAAPSMIGDYYSNSPSVQPQFTEYGNVGQFISGNFNGSFMKITQSTADTVTVSCSFRVRRVP